MEVYISAPIAGERSLPYGLMRDEVDDLLDREAKLPGATGESVFIALVQFDAQLTRRRSKTPADKRRRTMLHDRAERILLYFRHGFTAGNTTVEDARLIGLIEALPRSGVKSP
jgi:hypothetical protein